MALRFTSLMPFPGIDTTGATAPTTVNRSPTGPNAHEIGMVVGQVLDLTNGNDITQEFVLVQSWADTSEKVANYGLFQVVGFNNSGKQCLAVFMAP